MTSFVDRESEIFELNELLEDQRGQLIIAHGRRRVGKTRLLLHWAKESAFPYIYWVARRESPQAIRTSLATALWQYFYPDRSSNEIPTYGSWSLLFEELARLVRSKRVIVIFDEFPYAVEADSSLPSHLQISWDQHLKDTSIVLVLAGSQISMMVDLLDYEAPLYGRSTAQFPVEQLPFYALSEFFPKYSAVERVSTYAMVGGIPAYLERFTPSRSLSENIRQHLFNRSGMFRSEPSVLISELVRETRNYEAIIRSIANGNHTSGTIARASRLSTTHIPAYMKQLIKLKLVERKLSATISPKARHSAKRGRYYLRDAYLRFYFRFIEPNLEMLEQNLTKLLWDRIREQFRAFVGATAFEELCQEWVIQNAKHEMLPFRPELVGSHWASNAQVDVVAINWREKEILLGECKWGGRLVGRRVIQELIDKAPLVVPGEDWKIHYAFFARSGFTQAARKDAESVNGILVDLKMIDTELGTSPK